jgi:hypothetical protein
MAFPIPRHANAAWWQSILLTRIGRFALKKCPDSDVESEFRRKPEIRSGCPAAF